MEHRPPTTRHTEVPVVDLQFKSVSIFSLIVLDLKVAECTARQCQVIDAVAW